MAAWSFPFHPRSAAQRMAMELFSSRRVPFRSLAASATMVKGRVMNKIAAIPVAVVALVLGYGLAPAQEKVDENKTQELKRVDPVPPATGQSLPEQAGTQEPSTKGKGPKSSAEVFVNGMLAVPGAATDGQAVPSKYS